MAIDWAYLGLPQLNARRQRPQPVEAARAPSPDRSVDELFDQIAQTEGRLGIMADLATDNTARVCRSANGRPILHGSYQYIAALERRMTRLLGGARRPGKLLWDEKRLAMWTRPTSTGSSTVCCINMKIPITKKLACECGEEEEDYKCRRCRQTFDIVFILDHCVLNPLWEHGSTLYQSRRWDGPTTLDQELSPEDAEAWKATLAHCETGIDWGNDRESVLAPLQLWHRISTLISLYASRDEI